MKVTNKKYICREKREEILIIYEKLFKKEICILLIYFLKQLIGYYYINYINFYQCYYIVSGI